MTGRPLCPDAVAFARGYGDPGSTQRRRVLAETLAVLSERRAYYLDRAERNLARWHAAAATPDPPFELRVVAGDWGEVTADLTRQFGVPFAVLNMANAYVPGGAYVEGAVAQEENMFRRSDCHFHVDAPGYDPSTDRYSAAMTRLISGQDGRVYLDPDQPRVCVRGREDRARPDLGYRWLDDSEVFPFFELRAAGVDLRDGRPFDPTEARRRIAALLDTLIHNRLRNAVLGALGCGAFRNPTEPVARIFGEEILARRERLGIVAFAIFNAGYGPDNHAIFARVLGRMAAAFKTSMHES